MIDATVIVQHLASVAIFCCCFVAIFDGRVSPVAVVGWASFCTILAWFLWDHWVGQSLLHSSDADHSSAPKFEHNESEIYPAMPSSTFSPRTKQRLETAKSAILIYAALLGLSPILKSLTLSTTSDSIWALSSWLLMMNVAFFDYSGGSGARYVFYSFPNSDTCIDRFVQTARLDIHKLRHDGFSCSSVATAFYYPCILLNSLLHRSLRPLSYFSQAAQG